MIRTKKIFRLVCLASLAMGAGLLADEGKPTEQSESETSKPEKTAADVKPPEAIAPPTRAETAPNRGPGPFTILPKTRLVYVVPVREEVDEALVYLVRRGVKEAATQKADLVILDMKTPGGRGDSMREIMEILDHSPVETLTYIDPEAFSAGAFIAVATQHIFMAPGAVIGAAAPVMIGPGGPATIPTSYERKIVSAFGALIRSAAQKYGYNAKVVEKMVDLNAELPFNIAGKHWGKGDLLTLTNGEAEFSEPPKEGETPRPIISSGTVKDRAELLKRIGLEGVKVIEVERTGAEHFAKWVNMFAPVLLILGILGAWFEIKTQAFGLIGMAALCCFLLFFFGQYIAALSGWENLLIFLFGVALILVDVFLLGGSVIVGLIGLAMMVASLLIAMVDRYPGGPAIPSWEDLQRPLATVGMSLAVAIILAALLGRFLPGIPLFKRLVLERASGGIAISLTEKSPLDDLLGAMGVAVSPLRPSGKAMFGQRLVDVVTEGAMIAPSAKIKVIAVEGLRVVVAEV